MRGVYLVFFVMGSLFACPDDPYCSLCREGLCILCFDSVVSENGSCDPNIELISHCSRYQRKEGKVVCSDCALGYRLEGGVCVRCPIENCADCSFTDPNFCVYCFNGILSENGKCLSKKSPDPNCFAQINVEVCRLCKPGFAINKDSRCEKGIPGCLYTEKNNECEVCLEGAYITSTKQCKGTPKKIPDYDEISRFWFVKYLLCFFLLIGVGVWIYFKVYKTHNLPRQSDLDAEYAQV